MNSLGAGALIGLGGLACGATFSLVPYFGMQAFGVDIGVPVAKTIYAVLSPLAGIAFYSFAATSKQSIEYGGHYACGCALTQVAGVGGVVLAL